MSPKGLTVAEISLLAFARKKFEKFTFNSKEDAGFNRVEVLIQLTIIITIIIIFLSFALDVQKSARDSKRKGDIESISKQLEVHFNRQAGQFCKDVNVDTYCYPQSVWFDRNKVPVDPLTNNPYLSLPQDGDKKFMICAKLEKENKYLRQQKVVALGLDSSYYCSGSQQ